MTYGEALEFFEQYEIPIMELESVVEYLVKDYVDKLLSLRKSYFQVCLDLPITKEDFDAAIDRSVRDFTTKAITAKRVIEDVRQRAVRS